MLGTMEANEILLQASKLPQHCFDIHITPREENAKGGKKEQAQAQKPAKKNQAEGGEGGEEKRKG